MSKRKVCTVLVDRANYGRLKPIMQAVFEAEALILEVLASGAMVLERFDYPVRVVKQDGFDIHGEVFMELEGSVPATMAKSVGLGIIEFVNEYQRLKPDIVLIIGDRYEALAATIAAAFMNLTIVHVQGGEVSGSIDESIRHSITKFSHYHCPATVKAKRNLLRMGEREETILSLGCPSGDMAKRSDRVFSPSLVNGRGSGCRINFENPYLLAVFHPTTTEYGRESSQVHAFLEALNTVNIQTILLWPNIDAGSNHISKCIRNFRSENACDWLRINTNFEPEDYLKILASAACAVGNSSSFVRDAGFFGTPVVLVGNRQNQREADVHVSRVACEEHQIADMIELQLERGPYEPSILYGDGEVSQRIVDKLKSIKLYSQKTLAIN